MQNHTAHELDVEMPQAESAFGGLAHGGEGFRQDGVELFACLMALAELSRLAPECGVVERFKFRFERIDLLYR